MSSFSQSHRRGDSGELGVFEATRYFSGSLEIREVATPKVVRVDHMPAEAEVLLPEINYINEKGKCKQPNTPGGRLVRFFNSFFQQSAAKKLSSSSSLSPLKKFSKLSNGERGENMRRGSISHSKKQEGVWSGECKLEEKNGYRSEKDEESDSSSDLFELKNYNLSDLPSGLPVFDSNDMRLLRGGCNIFQYLPTKR